MRVAALYDVHGNLPALEAVLADLERETFDLVLVGGDAVLGPLRHPQLLDHVRRTPGCRRLGHGPKLARTYGPMRNGL